MKFTTISLFLGVSIIANAGNSKQLYLKENVNVDGKIIEWSNPLPNYDKNTGINYDVANDYKNLYLIIKVVDNSIKRQIISNGFEIWINTEGKKNKTIGISYPLPIVGPQIKGEKMPPPKQNLKEQLPENLEFENSSLTSANPVINIGSNRAEGTRRFNGSERPEGNNGFRGNDINSEEKQLTDRKDLILTGFIDINGRQPTNDCQVQTSISIDKSGCMIYELAIPFNKFYNKQLDSQNKQAIFNIGFIVKESLTPTRRNSGSDNSNRMGDSGGEPMGGGGGPMGGGGGGPMGGGGSMGGGGGSMGGGGGSMGGGGGPMGGGGGSMGGGGGPMGGNSMKNANISSGEKKYWFKVILAQ